MQRGQGDVLIAWGNEALLSKKDNPDAYEIITLSLSILAEPSVAVVDKIVDKKGTRSLAEEYINYLYSPEGQELAAQEYNLAIVFAVPGIILATVFGAVSVVSGHIRGGVGIGFARDNRLDSAQFDTSKFAAPSRT